jgi:hypothetical protein
MAVGGRLIDGLHGASGAQYINSAYQLKTKQTNKAKFTSTGTIKSTCKIHKGQEILMAYGGNLWAGKERARKWRKANPVESEALAREAAERDRRMAQKKHDVPTRQRRAREAGEVSEADEPIKHNADAGPVGVEDVGKEIIGGNEWKQGDANREGKARGEKMKRTPNSHDPTTREGSDETGVQEDRDEEEAGTREAARAQGRQGAQKGEVPEGREEPEAPAQDSHSNNAESAAAHTGESGSDGEREARRQQQDEGETSNGGQGVSQARGDQGGQAKAAAAAAEEARQHQHSQQDARDAARHA